VIGSLAEKSYSIVLVRGTYDTSWQSLFHGWLSQLVAERNDNDDFQTSTEARHLLRLGLVLSGVPELVAPTSHIPHTKTTRAHYQSIPALDVLSCSTSPPMSAKSSASYVVITADNRRARIRRKRFPKCTLGDGTYYFSGLLAACTLASILYARYRELRRGNRRHSPSSNVQLRPGDIWSEVMYLAAEQPAALMHHAHWKGRTFSRLSCSDAVPDCVIGGFLSTKSSAFWF